MHSAEFSLLIRSCSWSFAAGGPGPRNWEWDGIDWSLFPALARRHRVQALAWSCLNALDAPLPARAADQLAGDARAIAEHNLQAAREYADLDRAFSSAGLTVLFLKGLTLGALVYREPFAKMGWDIDILVAEDSIPRAADLLRAAGFERTVPPDGAVELTAWHRQRKESTWRKTGRPDLYVELHSRLVDNRLLLPGIGVNSPSQKIEIASGIAVPTLTLPDLFAYLAVHGASSAWFRLKWVADLAGLLAGREGAELVALYRHAMRAGAGRAPAQALLLADRLFGTLAAAPELAAELRRDRASRWLAQVAMDQLTGRLALREPTRVPLGTGMIHLTQFALLPGLTFKLAELRRQLRDALA